MISGIAPAASNGVNRSTPSRFSVTTVSRGRYPRRTKMMIDRMIARMIPCSTPTVTTISAVTTATTNSSRRHRKIPRRPAMSISSIPIRNTIVESTVLGM